MLKHIVHMTTDIAVQKMAGGIHCNFQVIGRMNGLNYFQVVFKIMNQPILKIWHKLRLSDNGPFKSAEPFTCKPCCLAGVVKHLDIAVTSQKRQVSLANNNVVRGCVVVELLMPLFHKMAGPLFDFVAVHDVEDFVTNPLALTAVSAATQS